MLNEQNCSQFRKLYKPSLWYSKNENFVIVQCNESHLLAFTFTWDDWWCKCAGLTLGSFFTLNIFGQIVHTCVLLSPNGFWCPPYDDADDNSLPKTRFYTCSSLTLEKPIFICSLGYHWLQNYVSHRSETTEMKTLSQYSINYFLS